MRALVSLVARVRRSKWMPLVAKIIASFGVIAALGLVGTGLADGWVKTKRAAAAGSVAPEATGSVAPPASSAPTEVVAASASPVASTSGSTAPSSSSCVVDGKVDGKLVLNAATAEELDRLPGVGPSKALRIVELRAKLGRFTRLEELFRIKGIKRRLLEKIRPLVVLDPPPGCAG